jgi:predicted MFS family arabinose efflux permease
MMLPSSTGVVLLFVTLVQTLVTMSAVVPSAISPALAQALGVRSGLIGYQIAIVYGAAMATSSIGGLWVRRWGACRISQVALAFCAGGAMLATISSLAALAAGSLLIGLGYGLTNPSSSHLLEKRVTAANRNLIFSIKQTGVPLGGIAGGLMAPPLAVFFGEPWPFVVTAAALVLLIVILQPLRPAWDGDRDPSVPAIRSPIKDIRWLWRAPRLRWLSVSAFCFAAMQLCLTTFAVALLVEDLGFGLIGAGGVLSAIQAAGFVGRIAWGWLADRLRNGLLVLLATACVTTAGALATSVLFAGADSRVVSAILIGFGFAAIGWNGVFLAEVARGSPPLSIGSATGAALVFTFAGVLAGPPAFTLLHGLIGSFTTTFGVMAALPAAGVFLLLLARRTE